MTELNYQNAAAELLKGIIPDYSLGLLGFMTLPLEEVFQPGAAQSDATLTGIGTGSAVLVSLNSPKLEWGSFLPVVRACDKIVQRVDAKLKVSDAVTVGASNRLCYALEACRCVVASDSNEKDIRLNAIGRLVAQSIYAVATVNARAGL